jgi:transketolase
VRNVPKRFEAYGWHTLTVNDGNNLDEIDAAIREAQAVTDKPSLISVKTIIGFGMPTQGTRKAHSDPPGEEAVRETKRHLGWPEDKNFYVPDEASAHFREGTRARDLRLKTSGTVSCKSTKKRMLNKARC